MFLPSLLLMLLVAISAPLSIAQYYCGLCSDHTMCKYQHTANLFPGQWPKITSMLDSVLRSDIWMLQRPVSGMGKKCLSSYVRGVDSKQRNVILDKHNELRSKVARGQETRGKNGGQPNASNMKKLTWSNELASIAQRWADQCDYHHDKCRNTKTYWWVGQNIAISSSWPCDTLPDTPDWNFPMDSWYNEVKDFDKGIIPKYRSTSEKTGHYTQIVWANTSEIGCGYTAFFGTHNDGQKKCSQYYVCNYGMGGNIIDQEVYHIGSPRTSCPKSKQDSKYPGLCPN